MEKTLKTHRKRLMIGFVLLIDLAFQSAEAKTALILYDYRDTASFGKLGKAYAIMLRNLLGHFIIPNRQVNGVTEEIALFPVDQYNFEDPTTKNKININNYDATFYLGSYYDNLNPNDAYNAQDPTRQASKKAFLDDVMTTTKTVVWFKYNLWQLAWDGTYNPTFGAKFGFSFRQLLGLNAPPTATNTAPGFYDTVAYKGQSLTKYYNYNPGTNIVFSDPEIGQIDIIDSTKLNAQDTVMIKNAAPPSGLPPEIPYVVHSGNFWYFADMPFSYIGPRDRYLVICDLLHDILGTGVPKDTAPTVALVRLEDVGALVDPGAMKTLTDYLHGYTYPANTGANKNGVAKIPFSIATIPFYRDPKGLYNGGQRQEIHFADAGAQNLRTSLDYALDRGASIVMHGYTHQTGDGTLKRDAAGAPVKLASGAFDYLFTNDYNNVYTAISGDDFEFWDIATSSPIFNDSVTWAIDRMQSGKSELASILPATTAVDSPKSYQPVAWEAPHYHTSPAAARAAAQEFATTYQRVVYYTSEDGRNLASPGNDLLFGQFFPYTIANDYYGQRVLPENLGNIEYDISVCDPSSFISYGADELVKNAAAAKVVRDGVASFFFHPFWLEDLGINCTAQTPGSPPATIDGFGDFKKVVDGIANAGFIFEKLDSPKLKALGEP